MTEIEEPRTLRDQNEKQKQNLGGHKSELDMSPQKGSGTDSFVRDGERLNVPKK